MKKKIAAKKAPTTKKAAAPKRPSAPKRPAVQKQSAYTLRVQAQALKELVSLEKIKQEFLKDNVIGAAELDKRLRDYLNVILKLTATQAGSIMLREGDHLLFRASQGPRS